MQPRVAWQKTAAEFKYADGRRVKETYYINYLVSNAQSLCKKAEENGREKTYNQYFDGSPLAEETGGKLIWDIFDEVGSLVMRLNSSEVYQRLDYSPFGSITRTGESFASFNLGYGFAAMQCDEFIGRHTTGTRVYNPENARFQSRDIVIGYPYNPRSFNRYIYAQNDPKNKKDPDGFCPFVVSCLISGAVKAGIHLAKEAVVAGTTIVTKAAANAAQGKGFNLWEQAKSYAKDYRWDKLGVDTLTNFVTGCLDPCTGGLASVTKKVIKYGSKLGKNLLDCVHDEKAFFSPKNLFKLGADITEDIIGETGVGKKLADWGYDNFGKKLLKVNDIGNKFSRLIKDPLAKKLSNIMGKKELQDFMKNIQDHIDKDIFKKIFSNKYKPVDRDELIELLYPTTAKDPVQVAMDKARGIQACSGGGFGGSTSGGSWGS